MDNVEGLVFALIIVAVVIAIAASLLSNIDVPHSPKNQNDLSDPEKIRNQMRDEMKDFTQRLKKIDDDAIGSLLVGATMVRLNLEQHNNVPAHVLTDGLEENSSLCNKLSFMLATRIEALKNDDINSLVSYLMVWCHSIRALGDSRLVPYGKLMWMELSRGFNHLDHGYEMVKMSTAVDLGLEFDFTLDPRAKTDAKFIPTGLEPDKVQSQSNPATTPSLQKDSLVNSDPPIETLINNIKGSVGNFLNKDPNLPPYPKQFSNLFSRSPEEIVRLYNSFESKTKQLFELAEATKSLKHYGEATARLAAYSSISVYGFVFYISMDEEGVSRLLPEKMNDLIYSDFLIDVFEFGWCMLQHCINHSTFAEQNFTKDQILKFLDSDTINELYPMLLFNYLVGENNAEFAVKKLREEIEIATDYGEDLDNFPRPATVKNWDEMVAAQLIGDPNTLQAFNSNYQQSAFSDWAKLSHTSDKIRSSALANNMRARIKRYMLE